MSDVLCKHALCPDTQTAFCYLFKRPMFLCPMFCVSMRYVRTRKPLFVICLNHKTADVKSTSVQCSLATSRATVRSTFYGYIYKYYLILSLSYFKLNNLPAVFNYPEMSSNSSKPVVLVNWSFCRGHQIGQSTTCNACY